MGAPTIRDVAARAGVSVGTVSRYLNGTPVKDANAAAIDAAIASLGYRVNVAGKALSTGRRYAIGIMVPSVGVPLTAHLLTELERRFEQYGYAVMVADYGNTAESFKSRLNFLQSYRADGVVAVLSGVKLDIAKSLETLACPMVIVDADIRDRRVDVISADNRSAAEDLVSRIFDAGHTRVGVLLHESDGWLARQQREGAEAAAALREAEGFHVLAADSASDAKHIERQTAVLLDSGRVTALVCGSHTVALPVLRLLSRRGLKPGRDIGFAMFDSGDLAEAYEPRLTTVRQPLAEMAASTALAMVGLVAGQWVPDGMRVFACEIDETDSIRRA